LQDSKFIATAHLRRVVRNHSTRRSASLCRRQSGRSSSPKWPVMCPVRR